MNKKGVRNMNNRIETLPTSDGLVIGWDCEYTSTGETNCVLIVGRKRLNETTDIINAFEKQEAIDLYKKLTGYEEEEK